MTVAERIEWESVEKSGVFLFEGNGGICIQDDEQDPTYIPDSKIPALIEVLARYLQLKAARG